jgi:8-oxo-dGTP diphosphatase
MENVVHAEEKERSLFSSILLVLIAAILLITTAPIGFLFAIIEQGFTSGLSKIKYYLLNVALVLDQAGNVIMQHFLNRLLLKKSQLTYLFGNKKETISSVIGKNFMLGTLNPIGLIANGLLNKIDSNHTLDSIQVNVKGIHKRFE